MSFVRVLQLMVVLVVLVSAVSGSAVAQSDNGDTGLYESLENMLPAYNENADSLNLGPVTLAGTSNIYIQDGDAVITYSIVMDKNNRITALNDNPSADAKRKITTDRATVEKLTTADNPAVAFRNAVANDDIVITGETGQTVERVKWAVINMFKGFFL